MLKFLELDAKFVEAESSFRDSADLFQQALELWFVLSDDEKDEWEEIAVSAETSGYGPTL